jgi:hypothetical protein
VCGGVSTRDEEKRKRKVRVCVGDYEYIYTWLDRPYMD